MSLTNLTLFPGPVLKLDCKEEGIVTERAVEFLLSPVSLAPGVVLGDIFRLLRANPVLLTVFRRDFAQELLEHVLPRLDEPAPASAPEYDPDGIECLELYRTWFFNSHMNQLHAGRLRLHGLGFELREDTEMGGYVQAKGTRIEWGVSMADVRELLHLPVRVRSEVTLREADLDAKARGKVLRTFGLDASALTLGELIHALLWELSFHGGPVEQQEVAAEVARRMEDVELKPETLITADDWLLKLNAPSIEVLFESLGAVPASQVSRLLRELEDDEPGQTGLDRACREAGHVPGAQLRPDYQQTPGRELRRLLRTSRRPARGARK